MILLLSQFVSYVLPSEIFSPFFFIAPPLAFGSVLRKADAFESLGRPLLFVCFAVVFVGCFVCGFAFMLLGTPTISHEQQRRRADSIILCITL